MTKIYISPSDQTENPYAVGGVNEAQVNQQIGEALEAALARCGVNARCNRTGSISKGVEESNTWGAEYHICLHTNAFNGKVAGTRLFHSGAALPKAACQAVMARLAPITPGGSDNITAWPELYEVRAVNAWTVYIESGFHDNAEEAKWLLEHTKEVAEAIAQGMCDHLQVQYAAEPVAAPAAPEAPAEDGYEVKAGDTLWGIAQAYGTTVDALVAANGIKDRDLIHPGDVLTIPGSAAVHTVQSGDTLWDIAMANGTTVDALVKANGITNPSLIHPGQKIKIPS